MKRISQSKGVQGEVAPFLRVIRPMSKLDPAALHVDCGIRGQDLRLVVTNNTTASLEVVHACGSTLSRLSRVSTDLISLRILLPCGIVRADSASCYCYSGAVGASLVEEGRTGGFSPPTE
jgi:hypothetical protein